MWLLEVLLLIADPAVKLAVLPTQLDESAKDKLPNIIDDQFLTAVQALGRFEVIGQEDISALIGFEQQKDLLGCDDASCLAQIGGALGVDKIMGVKVAFLDGSWVWSAKIIDLQNTKVEARATDFVSGTAMDFMRAVPGIVHKLFGEAPPQSVEVTSAKKEDSPVPQVTAEKPARFQRGRWEILGHWPQPVHVNVAVGVHERLRLEFGWLLPVGVDFRLTWAPIRLGPFSIVVPFEIGLGILDEPYVLIGTGVGAELLLFNHLDLQLVYAVGIVNGIRESRPEVGVGWRF